MKVNQPVKAFTYNGEDDPWPVSLAIPEDVEILTLTARGLYYVQHFNWEWEEEEKLDLCLDPPMEGIFCPKVKTLSIDDTKGLESPREEKDGISLDLGWMRWFPNVDVLDMSNVKRKIARFSTYTHTGPRDYKVVILPPLLRELKEQDVAGLKCARRIHLPEGLVHIEKSCFSDFAQVTSLTIPKATRMFGCSAFQKCFMLQTVCFEGPLSSLWKSCGLLEGKPFKDCPNLSCLQFNKKDTSNAILWPRMIHTVFLDNNGLLSKWGLLVNNRQSCVFNFICDNIAALFTRGPIQKSWAKLISWHLTAAFGCCQSDMEKEELTRAILRCLLEANDSRGNRAEKQQQMMEIMIMHHRQQCRGTEEEPKAETDKNKQDLMMLQ